MMNMMVLFVLAVSTIFFTNDKRKESGWETTEPYKDVLFAPSALIQGMLYVRIKIRTAS